MRTLLSTIEQIRPCTGETSGSQVTAHQEGVPTSSCQSGPRRRIKSQAPSPPNRRFLDWSHVIDFWSALELCAAAPSSGDQGDAWMSRRGRCRTQNSVCPDTLQTRPVWWTVTDGAHIGCASNVTQPPPSVSCTLRRLQPVGHRQGSRRGAALNTETGFTSVQSGRGQASPSSHRTAVKRAVVSRLVSGRCPSCVRS